MTTGDQNLGRARLAVASVVAMAGAALSLWTRFGAHAWCRAAGEAFDCDRVLASDYSRILGVPLGTIGASGFLLILFLLVAGARERPLLRIAAGAGALFALGAGVLLTLLSWRKIGALCLLCEAAHVCSLLLALLLLPPTFRSLGAPVARRDAGRLALLAAGAILLSFATERFAAGRAGLERAQARPETAPHRIDLSDAVRIGDAAAPLSAVVFFDPGCPNCRACWRKAVRLVEEHPGRIRFFFKHYPLDKECNRELNYTKFIASCDAARAAQAGARIDRGADALRELLEGAESFYRSFLVSIGSRIGVDAGMWKEVLDDPETSALVARDIADARALRIGGVPMVFLEGRWIDHDRLEEKILERLGR